MLKKIYYTVAAIVVCTIGVMLIQGLIWLGVNTLWLLLTYPLYCLIGVTCLTFLTLLIPNKQIKQLDQQRIVCLEYPSGILDQIAGQLPVRCTQGDITLTVQFPKGLVVCKALPYVCSSLGRFFDYRVLYIYIFIYCFHIRLKRMFVSFQGAQK